jgi:hypothetical protein
LQVPFNLLQQETAALLATCAVHGVGTLVQSSLCQGWLTEQGVLAARLLLSQPHRVPPTVANDHGHGEDRPVGFGGSGCCSVRSALAAHCCGRMPPLSAPLSLLTAAVECHLLKHKPSHLPC